jgi:hypothetical protein
VSLSTKYIEGLIERRPDIYASEIQHDIKEAFGVEVTETTISRSLYRRGYSRKKVRFWLTLKLYYGLQIFRLLVLEPSAMKNHALSSKRLSVNSTRPKHMSTSMNLRAIVTHQIVTEHGLQSVTEPEDTIFSSAGPGKWLTYLSI